MEAKIKAKASRITFKTKIKGAAGAAPLDPKLAVV